MSAHVVFLGGAPEAHLLDWSEDALAPTFNAPVKHFLDGEQGSSGFDVTQPNANWRLLSTGSSVFYQSPIDPRNQKQPLNPNHDVEFFEHSFAVHADIQSSQLAPHSSPDEDETEISTFITEYSDSTFLDHSTICAPDASLLDTVEPSPSAPIALPYQFTGAVINIKAIPSADHLNRLQPQTMTVNLIAGVISIAPTKTVRVRRGDYDMDIIEITLGDETKAGFCISSWHTPVDSQRAGPDALRDTLRKLRPGDIVLVERVALSSFRDQVFGQSLNRRVSKNLTKINVVSRSGAALPGGQDMLSPQIAGKLRRVQDWAAGFIGPAKTKSATHGIRGKMADDEERLPPDSQT